METTLGNGIDSEIFGRLNQMEQNFARCNATQQANNAHQCELLRDMRDDIRSLVVVIKGRDSDPGVVSKIHIQGNQIEALEVDVQKLQSKYDWIIRIIISTGAIAGGVTAHLQGVVG